MSLSLSGRYNGLIDTGADQNSTVVFPLPMDVIGPLMERFGGPPRPDSAVSSAQAADECPTEPRMAADSSRGTD